MYPCFTKMAEIIKNILPNSQAISDYKRRGTCLEFKMFLQVFFYLFALICNCIFEFMHLFLFSNFLSTGGCISVLEVHADSVRGEFVLALIDHHYLINQTSLAAYSAPFHQHCHHYHQHYLHTHLGDSCSHQKTLFWGGGEPHAKSRFLSFVLRQKIVVNIVIIIIVVIVIIIITIVIIIITIVTILIIIMIIIITRVRDER